MIIKNLYSACIQITTKNLTILCDPWFSQGIADGSWYLFPEPKNALRCIDDPDLIYISHIHNDHYDSKFLNKLFLKFGKKKIIIPKFKKNYLEIRAKLDGFDVQTIDKLSVKKTNIHIIPNDQNNPSDVDSALFVNCEITKKNMINLNDNQYNEKQIFKLKKISKIYNGNIDFLALGYTGAGPYPQTFFDTKKERKKLIIEANKKKKKFFEQYLKFTKFFNARYNFPFAGTYLLGGKNYYLNKYRGNPDPIEIKKIDKNAILLNDFGGYINLTTNKIFGQRNKKHNINLFKKYINVIKNKKFDYEIDFKNLEYNKINFIRLMRSSFYNASKKIKINEDYIMIFKLKDDEKIIDSYEINLNIKNFSIKKNKDYLFKEKQSHQILIHYKYFFGLLSGVYHWANAIGGSMFLTRRKPNIYKEKIQNFLIFFQTN